MDRRINKPAPPALKVPNPHLSVSPRRCEVPAIWAERDAVDPAVVPEETAGLLPRFSFDGRGVPDSDGTVKARRDDPVPVAAERHTAHATGVAAQDQGLLTG